MSETSDTLINDRELEKLAEMGCPVSEVTAFFGCTMADLDQHIEARKSRDQEAAPLRRPSRMIDRWQSDMKLYLRDQSVAVALETISEDMITRAHLLPDPEVLLHYVPRIRALAQTLR